MAKKKQVNIREKVLSERGISIILGILVVGIIGGLVFNYFRAKTQQMIEIQEEQQVSEEKEPEKEERTAILPTTYQVKKGDCLWKIAERFYQSGYNWIDIARENNLKNPHVLLIGQELKIPDVQPRKPTVAVVSKQTIQPGKYVVQKGDWLSKIALRAYGDMFAWEKIYQANREVIGPNPNLIKPNQVLTIPE